MIEWPIRRHAQSKGVGGSNSQEDAPLRNTGSRSKPIAPLRKTPRRNRRAPKRAAASLIPKGRPRKFLGPALGKWGGLNRIGGERIDGASTWRRSRAEFRNLHFLAAINFDIIPPMGPPRGPTPPKRGWELRFLETSTCPFTKTPNRKRDSERGRKMRLKKRPHAPFTKTPNRKESSEL